MSIKDCFNKAAATYDFHCQLQLHSGNKLLSMLKEMDTAIDLGCGTGLITQKIKCKKLYALDIADKLLAKAKTRLAEHNVTFLEDSFDDFTGLQVDLAFANMSLQWSNDLNSTLINIAANLKPHGILAFSMPLIGSSKELHTEFSLEHINHLLENWSVIHSSEEKINFIFPSLIDSLRSIKAVGAHYHQTNRFNLISREKIPHNLTYNIGYFLARMR